MRPFVGSILILLSLSPAWGAHRQVRSALAQDQSDRDLESYFLPARVYSDDLLGVKIELPAGWNMLKPGNPFVKTPGARMSAVNEEGGCFAVLLLERLGAFYSLDQYLDFVAKNRWQKQPTFVEEGRENIQFGGRQGRLLRFRWTTGDETFKGFSAACTDDFYYYLLSGWSDESDSETAFAAFKNLEQGFRITKSPETRLEDDAKVIAEQYPYVTIAGAKMMCREGLRRRLPVQATAQIGKELMEKGLAALSQADRDEFNSIMAAALSGLGDKDHDRLVSISGKVEAGQTLNADEAADLSKLLKAGMAALPKDKRARLQSLGDKTVAAGIAAINAPSK